MAYPYQLKTFEQYKEAYESSLKSPINFWANVADNFQWRRKWDSVVKYDFNEDAYFAEWFKGAKLNITENLLDRHLQVLGNKPAIIWEPNNPEEHHRVLTYKNLYDKVTTFANVLKNNDVQKGDRVCIYMGMIPELVIAVLACARIGAIHSVIFGGFSPKSIADRIHDAHAEFVITCDGSFRGSKVIPLKDMIDDALESCRFVKKVIVCTRTRTPVSMLKSRDVWWEDEIKKVETLAMMPCPAEEMNAEDPLFILYTSGSTGTPKGVVHTCGGYMVYTNYTFLNVFQYRQGEIFFCTADVGWITGHSYVIYGPLSAGATTLMFEGIPTYPDAGRFWDVVDKHQVNILYTAPTAIRSLMSHGLNYVEDKDLSSLRVLGTVGEPINDEAWEWFNKNIGKEKCPIVDTWWQTENGGILISNLAGVTPAKKGWATYPLPGIVPALMDEHGNEIEGPGKGNLVIKSAWPSILRTTYGDHERCAATYFHDYPGNYSTGDGALRDEEGMYKITGRVDDVLNVSGHRIGTAELENAVNMHAGVVESAIVGFPHEIKGQGIYAFVVYTGAHNADSPDLIQQDITATVNRIIGPIAKPDKIQFVNALPKTRSGKIMRRILRKIAENDTKNLGDISTLQDPAVVDEIVDGRK